jgi:uncharacterized HAD superfamily protein
MERWKLKVGIDIDGVICSEYYDMFRVLTQALSSAKNIETYIITSREYTENIAKQTAYELKEMFISFDHLVFTNNKSIVVKKYKIDLYIDNEIEQFKSVGKGVCCLLVREEMNYDWTTDRFLGNKKTVKMVD